jgi:hypothetical protein
VLPDRECLTKNTGRRPRLQSAGLPVSARRFTAFARLFLPAMNADQLHKCGKRKILAQW